MSLLSQASLCVTPSAYKEGTLYSVIPSDGSGDMSVTRATTATRVNSEGLVELVPYNLVQHSEDFTNAAWVKTRVTITSNSTTAPNGTLTADKIIPNTDNLSHFIDQPVTSQTDIPFVVSVYAKEGEYSFFQINNQADNSIANFNLSNGTLGTVSGYSATIESVGGGWYRCTAIKTFLIAPSTHRFAAITSATSARLEAFIGNGTSGFYLWGAQFNSGTLKDYQKTETRLNIPRLDYSNGTCPSILVEPQRTNLALWSSSFDNAAWFKETGNSITANTTISPSGIQDADTLTATNGNNINCYQITPSTITGTYTYSAYVKSNGTNLIDLYVFALYVGFASQGQIDFSAETFTVSLGTGTIENVGNGWYRITLTNTYSTQLSLGFFTPSTTGTRSVFVWGAQLEAGSYATSYIPTTSASVTRNADNIYKTGISNLIGATEGVIFIDFNNVTNPESGDYNMLATISDSANNYIYISKRNPTGIEVYGGFGASTYISGGVFVDGQRYKVALAYKTDDFALYINGSLIWSDTSGVIDFTTPDKFSLGSYYSQILNLNSGINAAALWKTRLTNDELERLTGTGFNTYTEMANYYNYITQ